MSFACIHIPNFPVQAVVRNKPELRSRGVAITDGKSESVIAANKSACEAGVQLGMIGLQVGQLLTIEIHPRSRAQEQAAHAALLDLSFSFSPRVEDTAEDTITLDLEGLERICGSSENIAQKVAQQAAELGLEVNVAVASNPDAALYAARGFAGATIIECDDTSERLGPLPVNILAPSDEIMETLSRWGIRTFKALASLPVAQLSERLGQPGVQLQKMARGTSLRPLIPVQPSLHFAEVMELEYAEKELEPLSFILGRLLGQLCARLAARGLAANELCLTLELEPEGGIDFGQTLPHPSSEQYAEGSRQQPPGALAEPDGEALSNEVSTKYERTLRLPVPMQDSKVLFKLLQLNLNAHPPPAPVRKVTITGEPAKPRVVQGGLFAPISPDPEKLEITLTRIGATIGVENFGSPELLDTHRPAALRMAKFSPRSTNPYSRSESNRQSAEGSRQRLLPDVLAAFCRPLSARGRHAAPGEGAIRHFPKATMRVFRPPLPAKVETKRGLPVHVSFSGIAGDVIGVAGPWRSSGDWWKEESWQQDEWDVEIKMRAAIPCQPPRQSLNPRGPEDQQRPNQKSVLYRIYRDPSGGDWFVRGSYD
jgi:protein ImuB